MRPEHLEQGIAGLAALDEPVRRRLYLFVADQPHEVSRDEAARVAGISRTLAGFHLDRLVEAGLLEASYRRLSGRSGPGAGRPSKLYRRSTRQVEVTLPERRYQLAATILATAVEAASGPSASRALMDAARRAGERIGTAATREDRRASKKVLVERAVAALTDKGYEPIRSTGEIRLRNCPFHALVGEHKDVVCAMNLALMKGVIDGLGVSGVRAALEPTPGHCCVKLRLRAK